MTDPIHEDGPVPKLEMPDFADAIGEDIPAADVGDDEAIMDAFLNNVVVMAGREFTINEPDVGTVLRILNVIGKLGVRGETLATRLMKNPSSRAALFGMMAILDVNDLRAFAKAVLQLGDDKKDKEWLEENTTEVAPLMEAFFLNVAQSADLRKTFENFMKGATLLNLSFKMPEGSQE